VNGPVAVCFTCGRPYYIAEGHACAGRPQDTAGASGGPRIAGSLLGERGRHPLVPAVTLPEGTPHPDLFWAERGWLVVGGIWQRPDPGGDDGEEAAA
jgi:hypothetical protein